MLICEVLDGLVRHVFKFVTIWLFRRLDVYVAALVVNVMMAHARAVVMHYNLINIDGSPHAVLNVLKTLFRISLPVKHMSVWGRFVQSHFRLQHC